MSKNNERLLRPWRLEANDYAPHEGDVRMTPAERQQRKRDRRKAGLVRVEVWVPSDKADAVKAAIAEVLAQP